MPLTKSDFSAILKTDYKGPIRDLLNNTCAFLSRMERYTEPMGGNFCHIPTRIGRTSSIGARTDASSELLPVGDKPTYSNATFDVKSLYVTVRITGKSIRASRSENYAFAKAQTRIIEDSVKDFKKDINRQLFGDASAELCQFSSGAATAITISGTGYSGHVFTCTSNLYPTNPTRFLHAGMKIDARNFNSGALLLSGTTAIDGFIISSVDSATSFKAYHPTLTNVTTSISVTNGAIYREDNLDSTGPKEIFGLACAIFDDANPASLYTTARMTSTYGGVDRSSVTQWQGQVKDNSGVLRPFSVNLIESAMDDADINAGSVISLLQTNHAIFRIYGNILAAAKTVDMAKMELDGGWSALSLNNVPMVKDVECPDYTVFCLDETTWMLGNTGDFEWVEDDGGGVLSRLPQQDQYEGVMVRELQLLCDNPRANVKVADISHS